VGDNAKISIAAFKAGFAADFGASLNAVSRSLPPTPEANALK
jgi:hypothetical protein